MRRFFDPSASLLTPKDLVCTFTGKKPEELALPKRAVVAVSGSDIRFLRRNPSAKLLDAWAPFRRIYRLEEKETILTKSWYGGPNIASLVEELSAFGVCEFCLWGYVGGISLGTLYRRHRSLPPGPSEKKVFLIIISMIKKIRSFRSGRMSGVHMPICKEFTAGIVWSCDAIYRETRQKLERCRRAGVLGVEMEVASFYAVCRAKGLRGAAFLVVSDLFRDDGTWVPGFSTPEFISGAKRLGAFLQEHAIV